MNAAGHADKSLGSREAIVGQIRLAKLADCVIEGEIATTTAGFSHRDFGPVQALYEHHWNRPLRAEVIKR